MCDANKNSCNNCSLEDFTSHTIDETEFEESRTANGDFLHVFSDDDDEDSLDILHTPSSGDEETANNYASKPRKSMRTNHLKLLQNMNKDDSKRRNSKFKLLQRGSAMNQHEFKLLTFSSDRSMQREGLHRLQTVESGKSSVELLAARIEKRRAERVPITTTIRKRFLQLCQETAKRKGYGDSTTRIHVEDIKELRDEVLDKIEYNNGFCNKIIKFQNRLDIRSNDQYMLEVLKKAIIVITEEQAFDDQYLHLNDFIHYHTILVSPWLWRRHKVLNALLIMFIFYLITPLIFCVFARDEGICPRDDSGQDRWYYGWVSSWYFASATLTTVGYGDVTVSKDDGWQILLGVCYMLCSSLIMVFFFSTAIDEAMTPTIGGIHDKVVNFFIGPEIKEADELLQKKERRIWLLLLSEITLQFTTLILIGLFVSRFFVTNFSISSDEEGAHVEMISWTWMESLYWVVQTTTTIGYGDLPMPFEIRWFQIFYLIVGTYFVGNCFGRLGQIKAEIENQRRFDAWERRQLSKSMIKDIKPNLLELSFSSMTDQEPAVDQYEYALSSLLNLGKITSKDLHPIMEKFREMAAESDDPGLLEVNGKHLYDKNQAKNQSRMYNPCEPQIIGE